MAGSLESWCSLHFSLPMACGTVHPARAPLATLPQRSARSRFEEGRSPLSAFYERPALFEAAVVRCLPEWIVSPRVPLAPATPLRPKPSRCRACSRRVLAPSPRPTSPAEADLAKCFLRACVPFRPGCVSPAEAGSSPPRPPGGPARRAAAPPAEAEFTVAPLAGSHSARKCAAPAEASALLPFTS